MCEGCKEIIIGKKSTIRQAAFKNKNDFVEANELISIIHYKFFNWKTHVVIPEETWGVILGGRERPLREWGHAFLCFGA